MMNSRTRLLKALHNECPDHVPCAPDLFEMVPIRLSGRPSWEMLLYQDPPVWKARMDACAYFGVDAFIPLPVPTDDQPRTAIVYRDDEKVIARSFFENEQGRVWSRGAVVYGRNEPSAHVLAEIISLPATHETFEIVKPNYTATGRRYFEDAREYVGERGVIAPCVWLPCLPHFQEDIMEYFQDPDAVRERKAREGEAMLRHAEEILSWKPDVLMIGNSGMMIFNPEPVFRELALPWLKKVTSLARSQGIPTHIHCCGPERVLAEIAAAETDLTSIEPLEVPPMGDCDLKQIKKSVGHRLALKGNLHTTDIMLYGTPGQVETACKRAIDDAAEGGGFILSTGDQTPRDVKDETIAIMLDVAENYGKY